jgi:hypothetical protein
LPLFVIFAYVIVCFLNSKHTISIGIRVTLHSITIKRLSTIVDRSTTIRHRENRSLLILLILQKTLYMILLYNYYKGGLKKNIL